MINKGKLNGLSLFSGYAGIDLALADYVRPLLYCEIEKYAQGILLSRMEDQSIPFAPIWDDVTTLDGNQFEGLVSIIYGGFPCQDISVAGKGAGLEGERSGLFREIVRLCKESSSKFVFLENVPAIRTRGAIEVQEELAGLGYDCRWGTLSASEVGANHKRERWFCLGRKRDVANPESDGLQRLRTPGEQIPNTPRGKVLSGRGSKEISDSHLSGCRRETATRPEENNQRVGQSNGWPMSAALDGSWWKTEPGMGRVVDGIANRAHRVKALGNGVVPLQVKEAFEILMGIK